MQVYATRQALCNFARLDEHDAYIYLPCLCEYVLSTDVGQGPCNVYPIFAGSNTYREGILSARGSICKTRANAHTSHAYVATAACCQAGIAPRSSQQQMVQYTQRPEPRACQDDWCSCRGTGFAWTTFAHLVFGASHEMCSAKGPPCS